MFTINEFSNVSVSNIEFAANSVVLVLNSVSATGNTKTKVLTFPDCKDTKDTTIVKHLLKGMLAEFRTADNFNSEFEFFATGAKINGVDELVKTGIRAKRKFLPFLRTSTIYKTDSNGKLAQAIVCDSDLMLSDTALNIKQEQLVTLYNYNSQQFRAAMHHTAQAILKQCTFYSAVSAEMLEIDKGMQELANSEQQNTQNKQNKQTDKKELKKVS